MVSASASAAGASSETSSGAAGVSSATASATWTSLMRTIQSEIEGGRTWGSVSAIAMGLVRVLACRKVGRDWWRGSWTRGISKPRLPHWPATANPRPTRPCAAGAQTHKLSHNGIEEGFLKHQRVICI